MILAELVIVVIGLFVGYWIVSNLLPNKAPPDVQPSIGDAHVDLAQHAASWYEVLGVSADAGEDQIKSAYRSLMSQYHPDKVASLGQELRELAERKSKDITVAYREAMALRGG